MPTTIATRLQAARRALGYSQAQAAKAWNLSKRTLQHWEQGQRRPTGLYREFALKILAKVEQGIPKEIRKPAKSGRKQAGKMHNRPDAPPH